MIDAESERPRPITLLLSPSGLVSRRYYVTMSLLPTIPDLYTFRLLLLYLCICIWGQRHLSVTLSARASLRMLCQNTHE